MYNFISKNPGDAVITDGVTDISYEDVREEVRTEVGN